MIHFVLTTQEGVFFASNSKVRRADRSFWVPFTKSQGRSRDTELTQKNEANGGGEDERKLTANAIGETHLIASGGDEGELTSSATRVTRPTASEGDDGELTSSAIRGRERVHELGL